MALFPVLIPSLMILLSSAIHTFAIQFPNPNFPPEARALLSGDGHFIGDKNTVQLNHPTSSSSGVMFTNSPFNFSSSISLSTHFTFQIGNGIALVIIPTHSSSNLATNMSSELLKANRFIGIDFVPNVCSISVSRVSNVSKSVNVLKDGVKLSAWIDYRATLKRLDVRLTKLGYSKPVEPLISYRVDLGEILKGGEVLLGLVSSNGYRERVTYVYSWSSEVKDVPKWMHSIPVFPKEHATMQVDKKNGSVVSGLFYATGCGLLAASVMLFVWLYVVDCRKAQQEGSVQHPIDFKYEKIDVVEVKNAEAAMK